MAGHRDRIIEVDAETLALFAKIYDEPGTAANEARLPALHARELVSVLRTFAAYGGELGDAYLPGTTTILKVPGPLG